MALRKVYLGLGLLFLIILGATFGYESAGWSFLDSLYMVVITVFGVGFGEVHPLDDRLKIFTMLVILTGASAVVYIIGSLVRMITEGEIQRTLGKMKKTRTIEELKDHAIICGYGRIGQILGHELAEADFPFIVVDIDPERIASAEALGYLCVRGSATEEECLSAAGIERAKVLATVLPQDTLNVFITLTARNLNRSIRIMARGEQPATEKKLRQAGADEVVLPASIGALRIANSIVRPSVMQFLSDAKGLVGHDLKYLGLEVNELTIQHDAAFEGMKVGDIQQRVKGAFLVVAVKKAGGQVLRDHFKDHPMTPGDAMIVLGRSADLAKTDKEQIGRTELL
jgi:voltage-gated potassium channel